VSLEVVARMVACGLPSRRVVRSEALAGGLRNENVLVHIDGPMAGPDMVSDPLQKAGFSRVSFERCDAPISIGRNMDEAIEFALALGPAGETLRLVGADADVVRPRIIAALEEAFAPLVQADGQVVAMSSTWIIRAKA